tara:strand:- start:104 stop:592 length:489 start_codon:yes stop_codon:yes gene_type:complete
MKVIDNFLPEYQFNQIQSIIMSYEFPWFYNSGIMRENESERFQFVHMFCKGEEIEDRRYSGYYSLLDSCQNKLGVKKIIRIKGNLNTRTVFHRKTGWHYDYDDITTAILYINNNNGWTEIEGYGKIKSVANRVVIFDSNLKHTGVTTTDEKIRVMVNFNYEE